MKNNLKLVLAAASFLAAIGTQQVARAATFGWTGANALGGGSGAGTAWLAPLNWTNSVASPPLPTTNDIAWFGSAGTIGTIGINFNGINATNTYLSGIVLGAGSTIDRTIGNSSTTAGGTLNLAGVNGGVSNLVSARTLTLAPYGGGNTFPMTLTLLSNVTFNASAGASNVVTAVLLGTGNLTNTGAGQLALLTNNTRTGKTILVGGALLITNETGLGTNTGSMITDQLTFQGGTLRTTNNVTLTHTNRGITLAGNGVLAPDSGFGLTLTVPITGAGALTVNGSGTTVLSGANTYSGALTVSGSGTTVLLATNAPASVTLNNNAILRIASATALGGSGGLTVNPNNAETGRLELSNNVSILSPARTLTYAGRNSTDGIRNISGNNTIAGPISFTTGGAVYAIDSTSGTLTLSGGVTSTATGVRILTLQGASSGTVSSPIVNGSATMSLTKGGVGTWTLTANNTFSGITTISGGLLALSGSGSIANSPSIFVGTDSTLHVGAVTGGFSVASGQTLSGVGIVVGAVRVPNGSTLALGAIGSAGTLQFINNLAVEDGASLGLDLASTTSVDGGTNDLLLLNGNLSLSGVIRVSFNFLGGAPAIGVPYTVVRYGGLLTGSAANLVATNCAYTATFDTGTAGEVRVTFTGAPAALVWNGSPDGLTSNVWDVGLSTNWLDGVSLAPFLQGNAVLFNDTAATQTVNLVSGVSPSSLTVNSSLAYLLQGAGSLSGGNLLKDGVGTLTVNSANTTPGAITVQGGTLKVGNAAALGNSSGITVNGTGQIDLNGVNQGTRIFNYTISGNGPDGLGAIKNTVAAVTTSSGIKNLTLAADATIGSTLSGGSSRLDIVYSGGLLNGAGNKLTKVGPGQLSVRGMTINLAEFIVNDGLAYSEDVDSNFGSKLTINPAGSAGIFNNRIQTAEVVLNGGTLSGVGPSSAATGIYTGPVTINSDSKVDTAGPYGGANVTLNGPVGGLGGLTKINANTLTLNGTNTYAGGTTISNGLLQGTSFSVQGNVTNYAALILNQAFDGTLAATVSGTGSFLKRGTGKVIITTPMTLSGTVTHEAGTLALGADNVLGTGLIDIRGAGGLFPAFESADASTRTLNNPISISTDHRLGSATSGDLVFSGPINNGGAVKSLNVSNALTTFTTGMTNTGPFNKFGPGTLALGGHNNNTGVVISNGTVALISGGAFTNFPNMTIASGAVLDYSAGAGTTFTNISGRTLIAGRTSGVGNDIVGNLLSTGTVTIAAVAVPATLTVSGDITVGGGTLNFDLASVNTVGSGVNDYISNPGVLTLSGPITIAVNLLNGSLANGTYRLMKGDFGVLSTATYTLTGTNGLRQSVAVNVGASTLELIVSGTPSSPLTWLGTNVNWDITTTNWLNGLAQDRFFQADSVLFDNSSTNTNVVVAVSVQPSSVMVNSSSNYAFSGAGKISGGASYTKSGTGTNLMSLANDYTGLTMVNGGIFKMGNASALGATNRQGLDARTIINGGSLDLNGQAVITESFIVQGAGPGGNGALVNNGAAIVNGGPRAAITLSGDTTFGAPNRWDLQGGATLNGGGFKLTKMGGSEMFMSGLGETSLGDVDVQQGFFTWGANSTAGDPTKTYNVAAGAILNFFAHTVPFNKMLTLQNGSLVQNGSGTAILAGPVTLAGGAVNFNLSSPVIVSNVISGPGVLLKNAASTLTLLMTNEHTGGTLVSAGTLTLGNGVFTPIVTGLLTNNATVDLNPAYAYPFTNFMAGSGTFTKSGTNSAQLAGLYGNDQLGDLLTLNVTGGAFDWNGRTETIRALAGSFGTAVSNSAGGMATMILANPSGVQTYSGSILGNTRVVIRDAATKNTTVQIFAGTNTFTGGLLIDNGQLRVGLDAHLGAVPSAFDAQNITLRNGGLLQNNNTYLYLHPNRGIYLESGDGGIMSGFSRDIAVLGVISGPGRFVKLDGGRVLLQNANTFTGDTVLQNLGGIGPLRLDHPLALQNSTFDATGFGQGGTLDLNFLDATLGGLKGSGATIANFTGRLTVGGNGQSTTFGGALSGSGSLVKVGSGVLDLTGANTVPGGTIISNGTLNVAGSLAGGTVTVRSGAALGGFGNVNAHVVADPGALVYPGASVGTLTISSNATFNGASLLFELANLTTIGLGVNDLIQVNGGLSLSGLNQLRFGFVNGAPASGTYTIIRYTGALTGSAANLSVSNSRYTATVDTSVLGEVRVTFSGSSSNLVWRGDGAVNAWDLNTSSNWFDGVTTNVFRDGDHVTFDNTGSNNAPVALQGLLAPAVFTVNAAIDYTFAGPGKLATPNGLTKLGAGKLTLANTNDSFGPLNILGGTVAVSADENLGNVPPLATPGRVVLNGGALQVNSTLTLHPNRGLSVGPTTGAGGGTIEVPSVNSFLYGGILANNGGVGSLTKAGTGTLILSGANTYGGNTVVSKGRILARNATALGAAGSIVFGDASSGADPLTVLLDTATNGASLTTPRDIVVSSSGTGPVTLGSTARFGYPGGEQAFFNGNISLNNRDLYLQSGAGDYTRFNGFITGTGNLIITNGSLTGDQRGNGGNRILLDTVPKTFTGNVTILSGSATNFTVLQVSGGGTAYDVLPNGANVEVQSNAVLRLFGHEAINGLTGLGRVRGVVNQYILSVGASNATSTFHGVMENDPFDGGSLAVTKLGTGNFTLGSVSTYTGPTVVGGGTFTLGAGAAITNSASITMSNGTTLDASALAGGLTLRNNQTLSSFGTVAGALTVLGNTTVNPGLNGVAGTLTVNGNASIASAARLNFDLGSLPAGPGNDLIAITGDLALSGVSTITINAAGALTAGTYTLINCSGTKTSAGGAANLVLVNNTSSTMALGETANAITLTVSTSGRSLVWAANATNGFWDINVTTNWLNSGALDRFLAGDAVLFDSTSMQQNVTNNSTVLASTVTLTGTTNYNFFGSGRISGSAMLVNNSSSTNTMSLANDFNGPVTVQSGVLKAGNAAALGSTLAGTFVASGATLDVNNQNLGAELVTASGTGLNGQGAIVNSTGGQINALRFVTLAGDTTFGGPARWDIRVAGTAATAALSTDGNGYKLTKLGAGQVSLVGVQVDPALGDIDLLGGLLGIETTTTGLGDPAATLRVGSGTTFILWDYALALNKPMVLSNTATLNNGSGNNRIFSPITLDGSNIFNIAGSSLTVAGPIGGSGLLSKITSGSTLILAGNNNYSGGTFLGSGTLMLAGNNANVGGALVNSGTTLQLGSNGPGGTISGVVTNNGTLNLQRTDDATHNLTVSGLGTINHASGSGPVTLNGNITNANLNVRSGNNSALTLGPGNYSLTNVAVGNTPSGWMNILPGATVGIPNTCFVGDASGGNTGVVVQTGGDVAVVNQVRLGHWPNNVSTYLLGGGSLSVTTVPAVSPAGVGEQNGGFYIGVDGVGIFTQTGGVLNVPGLVLDNRGSTFLGTATNTYELRGGTLNLGPWGFLSPNPTYQINLGGGTVASSLNWTSTLNMRLTGSGGDVIFNPAGFNNFLFGVLAGPGGLAKAGAGSLILSNASTFTGGTLITGGTLALVGPGGIASSPTITVGSGAFLDTSAKSGGFTVGAAQTLRGNGTVLGLTAVAGTVAPGASIGTLTFDRPLTLAGTTSMEIDRGAGQNADLIIAPAITNGGTLIVTNIGGVLAALDTFNLFDAASFSGTFTSIVLPPLTGGLAWDISHLYVDGTIRVVVPPSIVTHPTAQTGECSSDVTFTVVAAGTAPLGYQWRSNGVAIVGANSAALTLNNLNLASSGSFDVVVVNVGGSATSTTALLSVADTTAPSVSCPANMVAECTSSNGAVATFIATAADSCAGTLVPVCVPASGSTFAIGTNIVTCTATDGSGNTNACTFTVAVIDTTPPIIVTCATNRTLSASAACQLVVPNVTSEVVATDLCGAVVITQSPVAGTLVGLGLTSVIVTVADAASNTVTCTFDITVIDSTPPMLTCPANVSVQCDTNIPLANFAGGTVSDNCDLAPVVTHVGDVASGSCPKTIVRTYRATDASGNTNDCAQTITVHDTTAPMLICPAPVSVQCPADVPVANVLLVAALDNCDSSPTVSYVADVSSGVNPTIITRTYRATDLCGNTNDCMQIITIQDTTAPIITTCALSSFIVGDTNGVGIVPDQRSQVAATDNCVIPTIIQVPAPGSMISTGVHVLTFTAIDSASNTSACTAMLTVVAGAIPPTITMQPVNTTGECGSNAVFMVSVDGTAPFGYQWYFGTNVLLDATNALLEVTALTPASAGSYSVIVTNDGGSITSSVVTLTVVDTIAPSISCPPPVTVQCDADAPAANFAGGSVLDGCDASPSVTHLSDVTSGTCPKFITRTYRATDASGNTKDCAQIITIQDTTPPTLVCPAPVNVQCDADVPAVNIASVTAADNCGATPTVTHVGDATSGTCPKIVTRTYRATDACGNTNDCTQIITINDTTPPTLVCPAPVNVQCESDVPVVNIGSVTAADNCGVMPTVMHISDTTNGACPTIITRTYRATDPCGNTNDCAQIIAIHDTTAPTLACPLPVTVECDADVPAVNTGSVTAADNCGVVPTVTHVSDTTSGSCPRIITRTYRATDACGNTNDCAQIITVRDTMPPVVTCSPNRTLKSASTNGANVSFTVTATDNCTASPSVVCVPASGGLFPIGTSGVTCTASDACGNTNVCGFTVTVFLAAGSNIAVNEPVPDIPSLGLVSVLNVASPIGSLSDVNVTLNISNGWNGDLFAYLVHESGYAVLLNRVGKTGSNPLGYSDAGLNVTLDDQAANDVHTYRLSLFGNHNTPLAGALTNSWQPDGRAEDPSLVLNTTPRTDMLSAFNGMNPNGEWVLFVEDDATGDISTLVSWGLELCGTLGVSPTITAPPQNVAINCGSNAVLNVSATGTGPVGYHWLRNGIPIPGANAAIYAINNAHPTDNATYSVIVSNAFGSLTSSATLVVTEPNLPVILTQPQSVTNNVGTTVSLSVTASSCSALSYQWCFGVTPLAGQTNATLTIPNVQLANQGGYLVKVSNAGGTTTSAVAVVTVNRPPVALNNGGATIQGQALMIQVGKLVANDSDADGDPLTVISVTANSTNGGSVVLGGGKVTYTPLPSFAGTDRFSYTISDGRGGFATADVEVLVVSGNLPSLSQVSLIPTPNGFLIRFAGIPGETYRIQRAPSITGAWTTITTQTAPLHGIIQYEDVNPPPGSGFYRTVAP